MNDESGALPSIIHRSAERAHHFLLTLFHFLKTAGMVFKQ